MVEWSFDTRDAIAVRETRIDFTNKVIQHYGTRADVMAAELVLGELIGNAVRHAPGRAQVKASFDNSGVTVAIHDSGNGFTFRPLECEKNLLDESGRGLALVGLLAASLEIECIEDGGCCVQARLDVTRGSDEDQALGSAIGRTQQIQRS